MDVFFIICSLLTFASLVLFTFKAGGSTSNRIALISYGVVASAYFFICNQLLTLLTGVYELQDNYTNIFMVIITLLPIIAALSLVVFSFVGTAQHKNRFFNAYLIASIGAAIALGVICFTSEESLKLSLVVFLPVHLLLPCAYLVTALQSVKESSQKAKLYVVHIVTLVAAIASIVSLLITSASFINLSMVLLIIVVLYTGFIGLLSTILQDRRIKRAK